MSGEVDAMGQVPLRFIEKYKEDVKLYADQLKDRMFARKVFPQRKVSEDTYIEKVTEWDRAGKGAYLASMGETPDGSSFKYTEKEHKFYQIVDGFVIHRKELGIDPKQKSRMVEIVMANIHRLEDQIVFQGDADRSITGLLGYAQANPLGKIEYFQSTPSAPSIHNHGAWDGSSTNGVRDMYEDFLAAKIRFNKQFAYQMDSVVGSIDDLIHLWSLDSQRIPYWKHIAPLFKATKPEDFMIEVPDELVINTTRDELGYVYCITKRNDAFEYVVSENPTPIALPMQRGGNFPIEFNCWFSVQFHQTSGAVEIDTWDNRP